MQKVVEKGRWNKYCENCIIFKRYENGNYYNNNNNNNALFKPRLNGQKANVVTYSIHVYNIDSDNDNNR